MRAIQKFKIGVTVSDKNAPCVVRYSGVKAGEVALGPFVASPLRPDFNLPISLIVFAYGYGGATVGLRTEGDR